MMERHNDFQLKVTEEVKRTKKRLYIEEFVSLTSAICFGANLACIAMTPFTFLSIVNVFFCYMSIKMFKPTVKAQFYLQKHLEFLDSSKNDKVWTQND